MRVVLSGASGFIGSALAPALAARGHRVSRLVRRAPKGPDEIAWDPDRGTLDAAAFAGVDAVVHLSGESIAQRWTAERKRRIWASRVGTTRLIASAIASAEPRPRVLVSMSAIGWYGDRGDELITERDGPGRGWLAELGQAWESAADGARAAGVRVVHPRLGLVLGEGGGVLEPLRLPFSLGLGGPIGDGLAWWSWIALEDVTNAIAFALDDQQVEGPVNLTAPGAVRNHEFTRTLGRVLHRPAVLPVPPFALRLVFGRAMADEMLLSGAHVVPAKLVASGYTFAWPDLEPALRSVLRSPRS